MPWFASFFPRRIWRLSPDGVRRLYLTFDDGPTPGITDWVLDQLARHNAKGTFFFLGKNAVAHPQLVDRARREGHTLGHHTYHHANGWKTRFAQYLEEVEAGQKAIGGPWFRPPYGKISAAQARAVRQKGLHLVMWDVLSKDYQNSLSPEKSWQRVKKGVRPGSIVVFHDSRKAEERLRYALPRTLDYFGQEQFHFCGLNEAAPKASLAPLAPDNG